MNVKHILYASAGLLSLSSVALAQTAADSGVALQDIVVTAEKRSVNLQDVPLAVSAFNSETRQLMGLNTLQDMTNFTPGLTFSSGTDRVFIRGVGRQTNTNGSDPGVATYTDGVYNSSTFSVASSDFFVDRVEVLRGPQGTLYGRNSIGGAINTISKRPTEEFQAELRGTLGNYGVYNLEASASGALMPGLRARIAGASNNQDKGYFTNDAGGGSEGGRGHSRYIEMQLEADLGPDVVAWVKAFASGSNLDQRTTNSVGPYDFAPYPTGAIIPGSAFGYLLPGFVAGDPNPSNPGQKDNRRFSTNTPQTLDISDNYGVTADLKWTLPGFDVRVLGGYQEYELRSAYDFDGNSMKSYQFPLAEGPTVCSFVPGCGPLTVNPSQKFELVNKVSFGSAELNLTSNGDGPFQWVTGLYYYQETLKQASHFNSVDQMELRTPANGPANPSGDYVYAASSLTTKSKAVFGQIDYQFTDTLKFTGGLRYTHDKKSGTESFRILCLGCGGYTPDQYGLLTPALDITAALISYAVNEGVSTPVAIDPLTGNAVRGLSGSWDAVTGTAGFEWKPGEDSLGYARYSRGYKSGGFNAGGISEFPQTEPESVDAFELGYKHTFSNAVRLNAAAYYYNYGGLQVPLTVTDPGGANLTRFFNLDKSESYGLELEGTWQATSALQLSASYGYAKSKVKDACCFVDGQDPLAQQPGAQPVGPLVAGQQPQSLDGSELPNTPRHKLGLNALYSIDFSPGTLTLSGSYMWRDKAYYNIFNRFYNQAPSFDQVDLRAIWTDNDNRYRVIAYVRNLFDSVGYDGASGTLLATPPAPMGAISQSYSFTPPRTFGVQLQFFIR